MTMNAVRHFMSMCAEEIARRAPLAPEHAATLVAGAELFTAAVRTSRPRPYELTTVPAAEHLGHIEPSAIGEAIQAAGDVLPWIESPRTTDGGVDVALAPLDTVLDLGSLTCGLMLIAPGAAYPEHTHPPQEMYLPIAGTGRWRHGGKSTYRSVAADALVYNHPGDVHGAIAGQTPLVAMYVLWP